MQQSLRRPLNWQDFEELCKKLWGEIWDCPETVRHGRSGQQQCGIDVYGIPTGKKGYYGIQCKGKDEYTHQQFSEAEIDEEINKARQFIPLLEMYYLATTAVKDAKIEAYVRKKNVELRKVGLFGLAMYSWEDIVDLIDENRRTHDWYVCGQQYKAIKSADVTFLNDKSEIIVSPEFEIRRTTLIKKPMRLQYHNGYSILNTIGMPSPSSQVNLSYFKIDIKIHNSGIDSLEDYKLKFRIEGDVADINESSKLLSKFQSASKSIIEAGKIKCMTLNRDTLTGVLYPHWPALVGKDEYIFKDSIYMKSSSAKESVVLMHWELLAKEYTSRGVLKICVKPQIIHTDCTQITNDERLVGQTSISDVQERIIDEY